MRTTTNDPTELDVALCEMVRVGLDPDRRVDMFPGEELQFHTNSANESIAAGIVTAHGTSGNGYAACAKTKAGYARGLRYGLILKEAGL